MIENIEDRDLKSFEYTEIGISDGNITGVCELGKCSFETFNKNNKYSYLKKVWVKTRFGEMYIYNNNPDQANEKISFECYDARYKLDKEYDETLYSFPMSLRQYRNAVFDDSGLSYSDEDSFPNEDLVIENAPYVGENPTNRDVMKIILQAAMSILIKDYNDVFSFSWFNDEELFEADDCIDLTTDSIETEAINLIVLGRGEVEDNVYYPTEKPDEEHQFRIDNNYILDDQGEIDKRYNVIQALYERIKGFKYVLYDLRTTFIKNKLQAKIGSKIKFYNRNKEAVESYIMNKTITYLGGNIDLDTNYEVYFSAEEISESSTEIKYGSSIKNDLLRIERKADKNAGLIIDTVTQVAANENEIRHLQTAVTQNKEAVEFSITEMNQTIQDNQSNLQTSIDTINNSLTEGVENLKNNLVTININGINVSTNLSAISTLMSNDRFSINSKSGELFFVGYDYNLQKTVSRIDNLAVTNHFTAAYHRQEKMENKRTGWFYTNTDTG